MRTFNAISRTLLGLGAAIAISGCLGSYKSPTAPIPDPPGDKRTETLGIICEANLAITGSFVLGAPQPEDVSGCWGVGTWTFKAAPMQGGVNTCKDGVKLENEYVFKATRDVDDNEIYEYVTDPTNTNVRIKITSGGSGTCEGGLSIFSSDGKIIWNLKPNLHVDNHLDGQGEYEVYGSDQR